MKKQGTYCIANNAHRVKGSLGFSQWCALADQCGPDPQRQGLFTTVCIGYNTNTTTEFIRKAKKFLIYRFQTKPGDTRPWHPLPKRKMGKESEFLCGIGTINVHGRVCFCIPFRLCKTQNILIIASFLLHLCQDKITGSIQDSTN